MKLANSYSSVKRRFSISGRNIVNRWTTMLPGAGCEYCKKTGGCTMCGFYQANKHYSFGWLYPAFIFKILFWIAKKEIREHRPQELYVYNGGSFFNPREIPDSFTKYLFKAVKKHPTLKRVLVESRVEYLGQEAINSALKLLGDKKLVVGIGLESSDDYVRNSLIRKGLSSGNFEKTVRMLKRSGVEVLAYVFLKPLGLGEKDALEDTWWTIRYCRSLGIKEIVISCAFIQEGTKMAIAYGRREYTPPNLWIIVELIRRATNEGWIISIGSFDDEPPPLAIPHNDCPDDCSTIIYQLIEDYRQTGLFDFSKLPDCSCRSDRLIG